MEITIPFKTPTINHLYFNWNNRRILTKESRQIKKEIQEITMKSLPFVCPNLNDGLTVEVEIHENWLTKKGEVKKKDISNREKFLIDSIFDALNIDDKYIFEHSMRKVQSKKEYAVIEIKSRSFKMAEDETEEEQTEEDSDEE